jgi:hypothetical protein
MKSRLIEYGEQYEVPIERNGWAIEECVCCGCGLSHKCKIKPSPKKKTVIIKSIRLPRSTGNMRRYGNIELLNGQDKKWEMKRKKTV